MRIEKKTRDDYTFVPKTWGNENWIVNNDEYCGKVLVFRKNTHTSMHFHVKKHETMFILEGKFRIAMIDPQTGDRYDVFLGEGESIEIPRCQPHEIWGLDDNNTMIEFSTHHEDEDSYRVGKPSSK